MTPPVSRTGRKKSGFKRGRLKGDATTRLKGDATLFICIKCFTALGLPMPRLARTVIANIPYHVTQRGNRRENVFFTDDGRRTYLTWLSQYAEQHHVDILAYCLMPNHVHLVAVPATQDGLQLLLKPLHMRHAQRVNRLQGWHGHVWQGRYFSSALDEEYLWAAIGYVERNPVRARLVRKAESYAWSSAAGHCGLRDDPVLTTRKYWRKQFEARDNWSAWLAEKDAPERLEIIRRNTDKGLPCGADAFLRKMEKIAGRPLSYRPQGRPQKAQEKA